MDPAIDWARFVQQVDDRVVLVPCVSFVLYLNFTDDAGLIDFYDRAREALGDRINHYQAESMKVFSRLDARGEAMVHTWFTRPRRGKADYYMEMSDGDSNEGVAPSRIELNVYRRPAAEWTPEVTAKELGKRKKAFDARQFVPPLVATRLRVTLPVDHALAEPARLREWVLGFALLRTCPAFSAHAGYALNFYRQAARSSLYGPAQKILASVCLGHPGFDWDGGGVLPRILRFRPDPPGFVPLIKRVDWLNLLCDESIAVLGGRDQVRAKLKAAPDVTVQDLEHGLAVQAGGSPQIGDLGHRDFVAPYREAARVLRPIRVDAIDGLGGGFMADATNEWLDAFDRTYD